MLYPKMQGMIDRQISEKLRATIAQVPAVALLGARQVGKTTLAKTIAKNIDSIYLDLEAPEDLLKLSDPGSFLSAHADKLIILDEIQRIPDLFSVLRGLIDKNRERGRRSGQFLLLGSASMDLMRQSSESLAGRISYLEMSGLNLVEAEGHQQGRQTLWLRGGFPDSYLAEDDESAMDWLETLIRTYLERDIPQMGFRVPAARLRRLWTMLAHLQGETVNYSKLASNLEVDAKTVTHYIDILTDLLLVRRLDPWHINVKKRLVKSPRFYVRDSGILHRLLRINAYDALLSNPVLGKSWEGFVIENIHSILPGRAETYFYRTAAGAEIDLVIRMPSSEIWAVEIKYGVAPKIGKHYSQTCDDVGATHKYILYGGEDGFPVGSDIKAISLPGLMERLRFAKSESG
jgi:predicted AAA+ superfamily ATPase